MLKVENLSKTFGETKAVENLSLSLEKGEIVGLLGPNGAGKTTTMQVLAGLIEPESGKVGAGGNPVRDKVSVVFQETEYSSKLKVKEFLEMMGVLNESQDTEIYRKVGLESEMDKYVTDLSGGNKKKLNIASGVLKDPDYLLLDEPNSGLDPRARKDICEMIESFTSQTGVMVSTHSMEEAEKLCDRVIIIEGGKEVVSGSPKDLISDINADYILKAEGDVPEGFKERAVSSDGFFELRTDKPHEVLKELVDRGVLDDLRNLSVEKPGLEDVFFEVTGRRYEKG
ncbi:MAG: ABC transporter ATP-binding protein [Nanohaloarchaea archaeon]|nr:ABC transporter ATP-binding protein [Candidatus Nanohaloarchaea archaeon]